MCKYDRTEQALMAVNNLTRHQVHGENGAPGSMECDLASSRQKNTVEDFLCRIPLFALLKRRDIERLAEILKRTEYPPDTIVFHEGDQGDRLYIVVDGKVEIVKSLGTENECILRVCGAGEHIGEMCFLNPEGSRSASLRTRTSTIFMELAKDDFEALISRRPSLVYSIASGLCERFLDSENRLLYQLQEKTHQLSSLLELLGENHKPELRKRFSPRQNAECDKNRTSDRPGVHRINIKTFGGFQLFRGESPIDEHEWKANQPKLLLKAIITRASPSVPKDVLIEDLWPGGSHPASQRNFKVILHHLRRTLEPGMKKKSSYISLKGNLISINRTLCHIDSDEFLFLCQRGRKAGEAGDFKRALMLNKAAIALYKGDFLQEDLYVPWTRLRRGELRKEYVDLLLRTAELHQNQGTSKGAIECYRKVIEIDPVCEEGCQKLMLLYAQRGMCSKALKVFEDCRTALDRELGAEPDKLTRSICSKILEMS